MRRGSAAAVVDWIDDDRVAYDVVLLAGSPRRLSVWLAPDLAAESLIDVDGEQWMVADVRTASDPPQLICIYAR